MSACLLVSSRYYIITAVIQRNEVSEQSGLISAWFSTKDLYKRCSQLLAYYDSLNELIGKRLGLSIQPCCDYKVERKNPNEGQGD